MKLKSLLLVTVSTISACGFQNFTKEKPSFINAVSEYPRPWLHEEFNDSEDKFSFAIISDLTGGEREGVFDVAIAELALLQPDFIISVGDLIDGGVEDKNELIRQWDDFDRRAALAKVPIFRAGGNHDLTNLTMREIWAMRYGPRYYHFIYKNVLFLVLDSEDYSDEEMQAIYHKRAAYLKKRKIDSVAAGGMEYTSLLETRVGELNEKQTKYFQKVIAGYPDVRHTFLFMHKPLWKRTVGLGLEDIEAALANRRYTVFNGHFHRYSYSVRKGRDYIMLATTGGARAFNGEEGWFDHITMVTVGADQPSIANIKLEGILDKSGKIPANGDDICSLKSLGC
jgi:predicted MPP superfamily phosphohydrolase